MEEAAADEAAKEVITTPGISQLEAQLDRARLLRGRVWRRCVVDQANGNGNVTLTIEFPRPHAIKPSDAGKLVLYAFDLTVWEVGGEDGLVDDEPVDEPIDDPVDEPAPEDGDMPVEGDAADAGDQAGQFALASDALCQDEPAPEDGDMPEEGEGEGEGEEEEEEEEEPAPDDSKYEYEIKNYMGQFRVTAVVGNQITLELMEHPSPLKLQQIKDAEVRPWILFDTMPIDDPEAYAAWDEDTLKEKLPGEAADEWAQRGEDVPEGAEAQLEWVEVEFTRSHSMDLTEMVEQVEAALSEESEKLLRAELEAIGKTPEQIDRALEAFDARIQGLKPILDPELDLEAEKPEGEEDGAAPRPGVPGVRPRGPVVRHQKPPPLRVRFAKGEKALFDQKTATQLIDDGDATMVRRIRRWHLRDYARYFNFISARISELVDLIARSRHDLDRIEMKDATGNTIGGSIHLLKLRVAAKQAYYDKLKADNTLFAYELEAVKRYEALVEKQLAATVAQREALRGQVDALAKKLARVKKEQLGRIGAQPASAKKP